MEVENQYDLIIIGFVRELESMYDLNVPDGIKQLILLFYPKIINYAGRFMKKNAGRMIEIIDDFCFKGFRAAKLNKRLPIELENTNLSTTYRWRARYETASKNNFDAVIFGVVSNRCTEFHAYPDTDLIDAYFMFNQMV